MILIRKGKEPPSLTRYRKLPYAYYDGCDKAARDTDGEVILVDTCGTESECERECYGSDCNACGKVVDEILFVIAFKLVSEDLRVVCEKRSLILAHTYFLS